MSLYRIARHRASMISGAVLVLVASSPALALSLDGLPVAPRDLLLYGSLVLLVIGVAVRYAMRHNAHGPSVDEPDLRWWKHPQH